MPSFDSPIVRVRCNGSLVGSVAFHQGASLWEYDPDFLESGWNLSPYHLPLQPGTVWKREPLFDCLPGLLFDCLPDSFGTKVMERYFLRKGLGAPTPIQKLAYVGDRGIGALAFEPDYKDVVLHEDISLARLDEATRLVDGDGSVKVEEILRVTTLAGGAQRKALVAYDRTAGKFYPGVPEPGQEGLMVKFQSSPDDPEPMIEDALCHLAGACGIRVEKTETLPVAGPRGVSRHLAAHRFDLHPGGGRYHYHSFCGLMEGDYFGKRNPDYLDLLRVAGRLTGDYREKLEMFRRCLFNVVVGNADDHQKNHGFLFDGKAWKLSPAFDLTHRELLAVSDRGMSVAGKAANIGREDLERLAEGADIAARDAAAAREQVAEGLKAWPRIAGACGVPEEALKRIQGYIRKQLASCA